MFDKDTKVFISVSERPGNSGAKFHNQGYRILGLNCVYLPRKVLAGEIEKAVDAIKSLNIHGCSVSMPHKIDVIQYLDSLDEHALKIGAVNTVVKQNDGSLKGFNTDYWGAKKAIEDAVNISGKDVLLIGAGGVARAITLAVKDLDGNLTVANRSKEKAEVLAQFSSGKAIPIKEVEKFTGVLLINATSVGMGNSEAMPVSNDLVSRFDVVMEVVLYPVRTKLVLEAEKLGKKVITGAHMNVYQAAKQFMLYTGSEIPETFISKTLKGMTNSNVKMNFTLVVDVDGVMTTGKFLYSANGKEYKIFGPHDADGLKLLRDLVDITFITADKRGFEISKKRILDMGYDLDLVSEQDRYEYIKTKYGFENTIFIGDGMHDAKVIKASRYGIAPKNARIEAKNAADFVTSSNSGEGAVCDACLQIKKYLSEVENEGN